MTTSGRSSVMSRFRSIVLFAALAAFTTPPATHADDPLADAKAAAEAVLREAGLTRNSASYVLQDEVAAYDLTAQMKTHEVAVMQLMSDWQALDRQYREKTAEA